MKTIDRLIIKASQLYGLTGKELYLAFIDLEESGSYSAIADVWTGKRGSLERFTETADTLEDAHAFIESIAEKYPPSKDIVILINNGLTD